jgi:glycerophosphoryl diester phosphodiesterase
MARDGRPNGPHHKTALLSIALAFVCAALPLDAAFEPGARVLLDAHNCYPYHARWADRIDRALSTGTPLAIEQDLVWFVDPVTHTGRSLVAHDEADKPALGLTGTEPTLRAYFFERIRPLVERALRDGQRDDWPIITLNLDFKSEEPEHLAAVWSLLTEYRDWLTTAPRAASIDEVQPLRVGPVLVLTGESDNQRRAFHDAVSVGQMLLAFGAVHAGGRRTNYHRWSNNAWRVVEPAGQNHAGPWTAESDARLKALVRAAHDAGLWIRFYTLNGHDPNDTSGGWTPSYNFGSEDAARQRWRAAIRAGVDFIAVDQYELFAATLKKELR